jgi:hypothetical protein
VAACAGTVIAGGGAMAMTDPQPPVPAVPSQKVAQALADAERIEVAAAVLERRYPATRPDVLDATISELHSIARAWRRAADRSLESDSAVPGEAAPSDPTGRDLSAADVKTRPQASAVPVLPLGAAFEGETIRAAIARALDASPWREGKADALMLDVVGPLLLENQDWRDRAEAAETERDAATVEAVRHLNAADAEIARLRERAGAAEGKLAELRSVLLEGGQDAGTARRRALAVLGTDGKGGGPDVSGFDCPVL